MKIYKIWLRYSAIFILSIVSIVTIFNYRIDSLCLYGNSNYLSDVAKSLVNGQMIAGLKNYDERILQKLVIQNLQTKNNVIVLGSSRSMKLKRDYIPCKGTEFFNHSVSGASLEDYIAIIGVYEKTYGYIPSTIILGIDPWIFNKNNGLFRWKSLEAFYHFEKNKIDNKTKSSQYISFDYTKWKQLINYDYTISNISFFKSVTLSNEKPFYITTSLEVNDSIKKSDGSTEEAYSERSIDENKIKKSAIAYTQGEVFSINNYTKLSNTQLFENFVHYLQKKGTTVVFFLPPYNPITYDILVNDHRYKTLIISELYLKKIAEKNKINMYGSFNPHSHGFTLKDFYDGMHSRENVSKKLFDEKQ